jgi:hypothetical protein
MSPARFLATAVAIYGTAICASVVLYLVFRDSLEDFWEKLRLRLAHRQLARSGRASQLPFGARAPQIWESAALDVGAGLRRGPRQQLRLLRAHASGVAAARTPVPGRLAWAALAVVALAAATAVGATHDFGSGSETGAGASSKLQAVPWHLGQLYRPPHSSLTHTAATHAHASLPNRATSRIPRQAPPTERRHVQRGPVVSNLQPVSEQTAPVARQSFAAAASHGGGPTPLRAPKARSAPSPLKSR